MTFIDSLFKRKEVESSATGKKIRSIRARKKISAKELGEACDVNENAIRNYELGVRQVSEEKLRQIASRLEVPVEVLRDRSIDSYVDVMQILFELSESYELIPASLPQEPRYALLTKDDTLIRAFKAWYMKLREWEQKKVGSEEFREWKDAFPFSCADAAEDVFDEESPEHRYTDYERIMYLRKSLENVLLIINDQMELILNNTNKKDMRTAVAQLETLQRTINTTVNTDLEKYG